MMRHITSADNPFYKELGKLSSSARQRGKAGQTLLDGAHLLAAYLASGNRPLHLIVTEVALHDPEIAALISKLPEVPLTQLDDALFAGLSELKTVSGLLALIAVPQAETSPQHVNFCLLLENIQDPGNLGSMLRSAAAAGCDAVFMSKGCADAWSPRVLRAAMGGHFVLDLLEHADLPNVVSLFPGTIFAASLSASSSLYDSHLSGKIAFAIGNEGAGLTDALLSQTVPINIPMPGKVESLNAAAAAAICLFEAVRQRS
ncbi:MAG TPA: RNA methyltransferase [Gallionellaceae bacterium]|nr:RNA methyltransferase [Gallionellaceae bacterium]